jgi:hypothetical protein
MVPLQRVTSVARAMTILISIAAVAPVFELAMRPTVVDDADRFLAGETSTTDFTQAVVGYVAVSAIAGLFTIAAAIVTMIWMHRIAKNHRTLHRGGTWGPGWGIGGWFAPPLVWVIPTLMLSEMWKASDPAVAIGGDWRRGKASPLPWVWFVLWGVVPLVTLALGAGDLAKQFGASEETLAETITGSPAADIASAAVSILAAAVFIVFARRLTDRHRRLTGEGAR